MSIFSLDCLSEITQIILYPLIIAASASPIPVLPEVPSIIVPPGLRIPAASASSTICKAMRSFTELPGLKVSYFASTRQGRSFTSAFIFTIGVSPMVPNIFSAYFIIFFCGCKDTFYKTDARMTLQIIGSVVFYAFAKLFLHSLREAQLCY